MKVTKNEVAPQGFKPFSLSIEISTEREARMLQALTTNNEMLKVFINSASTTCPKDYTASEVNPFGKIWDIINEELKLQG